MLCMVKEVIVIGFEDMKVVELEVFFCEGSFGQVAVAAEAFTESQGGVGFGSLDMYLET